MMKLFCTLLTFSLATIVHADQSSHLEGKAIFEQWCVSCHGPHDEEHPGTKLLGTRLGSEKAQLQKRSNLPEEYIKHVVRSGQFSMPFFRDTEISDQQLDALAKYLAK